MYAEIPDESEYYKTVEGEAKGDKYIDLLLPLLLGVLHFSLCALKARSASRTWIQ
ncbi:hypothetical protein H8356DRAFT_1334152 [Neocallimastix lanati (nom. inval.)]|nr:hypothetical protein H8356DRAFT_1334152 [Neocallimastix sp. JGI-2020a]